MSFLAHWILTLLLLVPLGGAVAMAILRRNSVLVRRVALGTTVAACAVSMLVLVPFRWRQMLSYDQSPRGSVKLSQKIPIGGAAEYRVAADGLSIPLLLVTSLLFALLCAATWRDPSLGPRYFITLLVCQFAALGTFVCFDFLLLVILSAVLIATLYMLTRISGAERATGLTFLVYMTVAVACLIPALASARTRVGSFDLLALARDSNLAMYATWPLVLLVVGSLIRMAVFPLHSWLVAACDRMATPLAVLVTCLLPMTGIYTILRAAIVLHPASAAVWPIFAVVGVIGFLYGATCAMGSRDLRGFIAYSAISTAGCALFAVSLRIPTAIDGAMMLILGQSLVSAMLLFLARPGPPKTGEHLSIWTAFFAISVIALLVVPMFGGQAVILLAAFEAARSSASPVSAYALAIIPLFGILANGIATAQIARRIFLPSPQPAQGPLQELTASEITILSILSAIVLLLGILPGFLCYTLTHPAARALLGTH